jgi:PAS domain S-box-containing protein
MKEKKQERTYFFLRIILPTLMAFFLFTASIFVIIIPSFESQMLDRKREMINELTNSAWSILEEYHVLEQDSTLTLAEAQSEAVDIIKDLRYGDESKDYFWLTDEHPTMIMHPYRQELNNTDLTDYQDKEGKKLFVEFTKVVESAGEGFVDYMWQWKDDSTKIVPKLSYVKGFEPWGWIVGTGIYIEDVKEEISELTNNLIVISSLILFVLGGLLFLVTQQSLRIEKAREEAEDNLRESEAKYKSLVEASTEGLVMMLDGEYVFANNTLYNLFGISNEDASQTDLNELLCGDKNHKSGREFFTSLLKGEKPITNFEARINTVDGNILNVLLITSSTTLGEKSGYSIIVRDISSAKQIEDELDESEERFKLLSDNIRIGVFRLAVSGKFKITEINPTAVEMFGFTTKDELIDKNFLDFFQLNEDRTNFQSILLSDNSIRNFVTSVIRKNKLSIKLSISAVMIFDEFNNPLYCDGILEDVTEQLRLDEERENLIVELQASLNYLNEPINRYINPVLSCNMNDSIEEAAKILTRKKYSALLVKAFENEYSGIVTDSDLRERAIANSINTYSPVYKVMTSPIIIIKDNALVYEAYITMFDKSTRHLAVENNEGKIIGMISSEDLLQLQRYSSTFLLKKIDNCANEDIPAIKSRLPLIIKSMLESGAKTKALTKTITSVSDSIVKKYISKAIEDLGEPPLQFAFIALGSQGREEQTLFTDQDSAIILADENTPPSKDTLIYFKNLADIVIYGMRDAGYKLCNGESMANNPKWCQPLSVWKNYFKNWILNSNPQDLLELSIFFDFRCIYGEKNFSEELRNYLFDFSEGKSGFFQHLTRNCLEHKVPLNMLGNLILESKGEHPETFNIKNALMPLTDFARIYAIKNKIGVTNTLERLSELQSALVVNKNSYEELVQSYNFLMQLRLKHQVTADEKNQTPNNFISPDELTQIELKTLKNIFSQINAIQKRLSAEFTGESL